MSEEKVILLSKEEALYIARIRDNKIHSFLSNSIALVGADHSLEDFLKELDEAKEIEVGGEHCRAMGHALVLWERDTPYFFEHDEDKLVKLLETKKEV